MKIYFAAAIRGSQVDRQIYVELIDELKKYGTVLTEHIVASFTTVMGSAGTVDEIYQQDIRWLTNSDVVIAEITQPSLGVGYEIAYAENLKKPIMCLYRPTTDKSLSAMVAGSPKTQVENYQTIEEARKLLASYFKSYTK